MDGELASDGPDAFSPFSFLPGADDNGGLF